MSASFRLAWYSFGNSHNSDVKISCLYSGMEHSIWRITSETSEPIIKASSESQFSETFSTFASKLNHVSSVPPRHVGRSDLARKRSLGVLTPRHWSWYCPFPFPAACVLPVWMKHQKEQEYGCWKPSYHGAILEGSIVCFCEDLCEPPSFFQSKCAGPDEWSWQVDDDSNDCVPLGNEMPLLSPRACCSGVINTCEETTCYRPEQHNCFSREHNTLSRVPEWIIHECTCIWD